MDPEVMVRQVDELANDLRTLHETYDQRARDMLHDGHWAAVERVYLTGDGDSYHAACATELAFQTLGGVACTPMSALRFERYGAEWMRPATPQDTLVIAISASGGTERVVKALRAAREYGASTIAVTGTPDSPVTRVAEHALIVDIPRPEPSPGIRTYQASLLGLLVIACQIGRNRGPDTYRRPDLVQELAAVADAVQATASSIKPRCRRAAEMISDAAVTLMLGSGPSLGTALFGAAKLIEASGVFAAGQDLEEWCHVESLAHPDNMPVVLIAPPGRCHDKAAHVAKQARLQGRRVIVVSREDDTDLTAHAHLVLPVHGQVREEFTPLIYHVFAGYTACYVAERLGRLPFRTDRAGPA